MSLALGAGRLNDRARGTLLIALSTLAWSISGVLTRLTDADAGTVLFWRSAFACGFLLTVLGFRREGLVTLRRLGWVGTGVAASFAVSMITFVMAMQQTTVAHVLIFQAASPFFAGLLAWTLLGERLGKAMLGAIAATALGIGIMTSQSLLEGRWRGDALSLVMCLSFAAVIVLARLDDTVDMLAAACVATAISGVAAAPFAHWPSSPGQLGLLALFGIGQMGFAMLAFTAGVRLLPAAEAGLITVLEAVLAPLWTWLAVGENPGFRALVGGAIVTLAVLAYGLSERKKAG